MIYEIALKNRPNSNRIFPFTPRTTGIEPATTGIDSPVLYLLITILIGRI
ncbi:MAG: hypothetical protein LBI18_06710 [Planctomycetaceae bacterium]|nr:hypothetical protein [Planctomycetaceae bacterium]